MSHHGDGPFPANEETYKRLKEAVEKPFLGATGETPDGKISPSDEGEIRFAVGHKNGLVGVDFGKPVQWIGMRPVEAVALAQLLLDHARKCSDGVLTVKL